MISVKSSKWQQNWQSYLMVILLIMSIGKASAQEPKPERTKEQEQQAKKEYVSEKSIDDPAADKKEKATDEAAPVKKEKTAPPPATPKKKANPSKVLTDAERSALRREDSSEAEA